MVLNLWTHFQQVRQQNPLILNITNFVVMNTTANALLAVGASPIMAHAQQEIPQLIQQARALLINIGTLDTYWQQRMEHAVDAASARGIPWVLDPVGVGASNYRLDVVRNLLSSAPSVIRGNAAEIIALSEGLDILKAKGVDSSLPSEQALQAAQNLAQQYACIVSISGETDYVISSTAVLQFDNGDPMMPYVTGLGCTATALIAASVAVSTDYLQATAAAVAILGVVGELAAKDSKGPASLQQNILDKLYTIDESEFLETLNYRRL